MLCALRATSALSWDRPVVENKLNAEYGIVFKAKGALHNNLDRLTLMITYKQPDFSLGNRGITTPIRASQCTNGAIDRIFVEQFGSSRGAAAAAEKALMIRMCMAYLRTTGRLMVEGRAALDNIRKKIPAELAALFPMLAEDIQAPIDSSARRTKRSAELGDPLLKGGNFSEEVVSREERNPAVVIPLVTAGVKVVGAVLGLIRESRRDKAIRREVAELKSALATHIKKNLVEFENVYKILRHQDERLRAAWTLSRNQKERLDRVLMYMTSQSTMDGVIADQEELTTWLRILDAAATEKVEGLMESASGTLSPKLVQPTELKRLIDESMRQIADTHPNYRPVLEQLNQYYELKITSMFYDTGTKDIIVTIPIYIAPYHNEPLNLLEVETVHVPINDQNEHANSYTKVRVEKSYIAVNAEHYIQLTDAELSSCTYISKQWYCEERFMVKHKSQFSCESAIYYDLPDEQVKSLCVFDYSYNKTVPPSLLDGGKMILLANAVGDITLRCVGDLGRKPLPAESSNYIIFPRETMCGCDVELSNAIIQRTVSACAPEERPSPIRYQANKAILLHIEHFEEYLKEEAPPGYLTENPSSFSMELFPVFDKIDFHEPDELSELFELMQQNRSTHRMEVNWADFMPPNWSTDSEAEGFWSHSTVLIINFISSVVTVFLILLVAYVCIRQKFMYALMGSSAVLPSAHALATEPPLVVHCKTTWYTWLFLISSLVGLIYVIYRLFKGRTLCRGRNFNHQGTLELILADSKRIIHLPIVRVYGPFHVFASNLPVTHAKIKLKRGFWWDELEITWNAVKLYHNEIPLKVPEDIVIPFMKRAQARALFRHREPLMIAACLDQGGMRYHIPLRYPKLVNDTKVEFEAEVQDTDTPLFRHVISTLPSGSAQHLL